MGEVLAFPQRKSEPVRACFTCKHAAFGQGGTICSLFMEQILDDVGTAEECEEYASDG